MQGILNDAPKALLSESLAVTYFTRPIPGARPSGSRPPWMAEVQVLQEQKPAYAHSKLLQAILSHSMFK